MKTLIQAAAAAVIAAPVLAQNAPQEAGALLDAMTCRDFLTFSAQDQMTVMLAMRAHVNSDSLPDEPLPIGVEAEVGGADGLGGDSGSPNAEGLDAATVDAGSGEAATGRETADGAGSAAEGGPATAEVQAGDTAAVDEGTTATSVGDEEVVDGENESGKVNPDGTELSVTDEPADPKLTAMRTSCEGGPDALAVDAMRAAHADYQ